jgi:RHS repeat-associated protein
MSSRSTALYFGQGGGWRHSYNWEVFTSGTGTQPTAYTVNYPDGKVIRFSAPNPNSANAIYSAARGLGDQFQSVTGSGGYCYLLMSDGGKVCFRQDSDGAGGFNVIPVKLIDPYGLETQFTVDSATLLLSQVKDSSGRWLKIYYDNYRVSFVEAGADGLSAATQNVSYDYVDFGEFKVLAAARYSDGTRGTYTYQSTNVAGSPHGHPLIRTCSDVRYAGPMKYIWYDFVPNGFFGQLQAERYWIGALDGYGQPVPPGAAVVSFNLATHTETRGDGPWRQFAYGATTSANTYFPYLLATYTDFKASPRSTTYLGYDANVHVNSVKDFNGHVTTFERVPLTGAIKTVTHPADEDGNISSVSYVYTDNSTGYFLDHVTDERLHTTSYVRFPGSNLVKEIHYPNDAYEEFTYNEFNQVRTHRNTLGGWEAFGYVRGLCRYHIPPPTADDPNPSAHPTWYDYDSNDHLEWITDPAGRQTHLDHNQRGQLTLVTYPAVSPAEGQSPVASVAGYDYNDDGTLKLVNVQFGTGASDYSGTQYRYNDYKRIIKVIDPLAHEAITDYTRPSTSSSYLHTSTSAFSESSASNKVVNYDYDENFRRKLLVQAPNTSDVASTVYGYDAMGNLISVQDPLLHVTTFAYDARNRRTSETNAALQVTRWKYDVTSNLIRETRPDQIQSYRRSEYDEMNRLHQTYGFMNEGTRYDRDDAGNVVAITDQKDATYSFAYDERGRKVSATYPADAANQIRNETWHYDFAGNIVQYINPAGQVKTMIYDNRNRLTESSWSTNGAAVATRYDLADRIVSIKTNNGETAVAYTYDRANRKMSESQTLAGFSPQTLTFTYYDDNARMTAEFPNGNYYARYKYTGRNQVQRVESSTGAEMVSYTYDAAGNRKRRHDALTNISINSDYDEMNRPTVWEYTGLVNGVSEYDFARSHYDYDTLGRIQDTWRDEQPPRKGERFEYDLAGQLRSVAYNAQNVTTVTPQNPSRTVTYNVTPLNRISVTDSNYGTDNYATASRMNQYPSINGVQNGYDGNFNFSYYAGNNTTMTYDAENRLVDMNSGWAHFTYDGLGRLVKRKLGTETRIFSYDGWNVINEWDQTMAWKAWSFYGPGADELIWWGDAAGYYGYHTDPQGNVRFILNSSGSVVETYTYDAFGAPTVTHSNGTVTGASTLGNRYMFQGRPYFAELGFYDFRHRFYNPWSGQFMQPDPMGFAAGDNNLFRYCGGDPVNRRDPMGTDFWRGYVPPHGPSWYPQGGILTDHVYYFGVTDRQSMTERRWFAYTMGPKFDPVLAPPVGYQNFQHLSLTPAQDLVVLDGFYSAADTPRDGRTFSLSGQPGMQIVTDAIAGPDGHLINPVDPYTGNIYSASGKWVGWEDPDTGNIYDSDGDWAGWDPHYGRGGSSGGGDTQSPNWGPNSTGGGIWGNPAYMPGLLSDKVPIGRHG